MTLSSSSSQSNQSSQSDRSNQSIRRALHGYLATALGSGSAISDDADLVRSGAVASLELLGLVTFVADTFAVEVAPADLYDGRFATIAAIAELVEERARDAG